MTIQCIFPAELICNILSHTDPRDILQWRTVSKWFCGITYDVVLWKVLYTNAPFPRPPGPSPSQSTESLQQTLVRSAQLAQSWMTRPMREVSSIEIHLKGKPGMPHKLIHGRWFIDCESERRFVLHDVNAGAETHARQVLWEEKHPVVSSWDVFPMASMKGQCIVYVLCLTRWNLPEWELLEFRLNDQTGELYDSAAMDPPAFLHNAELYGGKSPFLFIRASPMNVVFDTRTRVFYQVPEFRVALDETLRKIDHLGHSGYQVLHRKLAFTNTYFISFRPLLNRLGDYLTVIQVFTFPPHGCPIENGNPVLSLTHEGVLELRVTNPEVLKTSVDPATGATNVRLLDYSIAPGDLQVTRIDLTLPKPSPVEILPMTIETQCIGFPEDGVLARCHISCLRLYIDVSDDGHARGFCVVMNQNRIHIMKLTIDTAQDQWVIACGKVSPAKGNHMKDSRLFKTFGSTFDGMRGRLCFPDSNYINPKPVLLVDIE